MLLPAMNNNSCELDSKVDKFDWDRLYAWSEIQTINRPLILSDKIFPTTKGPEPLGENILSLRIKQVNQYC